MDKFRLLLRPAGKRRLTGRKAMAVAIISVLFAIYQLTEPIWGINVMLPYMHRVIHLSVALLIVFLLYSPLEHKKEDGKESISVFDLLFGISAIGAGIYVMLNIDRFEVHLLRIDPFTIGDKIVGLLFLVLVFEAVRRVTGFILNFVILAVVAFTLLGHKIPGLFGHSYIPFWQFVEGELLTMDGLFGTALGVAANYIFLFVLFGVFLDRAGVGKVLFALASKATKRTKGGPAKVSIISSAMFGSISGAPVANVMTTGSITIPLMKRAGFSPTFAAAVESAASTGGTFTPPIMGSVAFLMAELTGISYLKIMVAAIIPCLLYYFTLYLMVHFYAVRYDVVPVEEEGVSDAASWGVRDWVVGISTAAVPLGAVVFVLVKGYTPIYAALVGIVLAIITSWLNKAKENRLNIRNIGFVLNYGTGVAVGISMICAAAGIVIGGLVQSGLTGKIASLVLGWSGGSLFMGLVFTAVLCVILGMGMPIPAAYLITASLSIPAIITMGVDPLGAHLFGVYFAGISAITLPVGLASYCAAGVAGADPWTVGYTAMKIGVVSYVVPFMFVYSPALLFAGGLQETIVVAIVSIAAAWLLAMGIMGWFRSRLVLWQRVLALSAGVMGIITAARLY